MREDLFKELLDSAKQGAAILRGEMPPSRVFRVEQVDIKQVRAQLELTQKQFAAMLGISVATLRNWEQGRRAPEGPARALLRVAAKHPEAVLDALRPQD
jgi:putative transcriptional regulator